MNIMLYKVDDYAYQIQTNDGSWSDTYKSADTAVLKSKNKDGSFVVPVEFHQAIISRKVFRWKNRVGSRWILQKCDLFSLDRDGRILALSYMDVQV